MSRNARNEPWQVTFACVMLFIVALNYVKGALEAIVQFGDHTGLLAQAQNPSLQGDTPQEIGQFLQTEATTYTALGVLIFMLALLLFRGEHRIGVRLTATIFVVVSLLGSVIPMVRAAEDVDLSLGSLGVVQLINILTLVSIILLWTGGARGWFREVTD